MQVRVVEKEMVLEHDSHPTPGEDAKAFKQINDERILTRIRSYRTQAVASPKTDPLILRVAQSLRAEVDA